MDEQYYCLFCGEPIVSSGIDMYKEEEYYVCDDCCVDYSFIKGYEHILVSKTEISNE